MNSYHSPTDVTMVNKPTGGGMSMRLSYTRCGHRGPRLGATFKNKVPWLCAVCTAARRGK